LADVLQRLREARVAAVIRADDAESAVAVAEALVEGGLTAVELTYTTPDAGDAIARARSRLGRDVLVGAGTLTTREQIAEATAAGADFLVTPHLDHGLLELMLASGVLALPGVLTPSEVASALAHGAAAVKLFPASSGGMPHLLALFGPFPGIKVVPTGGIDLTDVGAWLEAGAWAVGVGGKLAPRRLDDEDTRRTLVARTRSLVRGLAAGSTA
jgi:2-dehydro-3-deoxyphosphogluconate aldolase / (4S)-4-hydroxy-2-oxoglutarate aldolase